jgi:hypothetical protein
LIFLAGDKSAEFIGVLEELVSLCVQVGLVGL